MEAEVYPQGPRKSSRLCLLCPALSEFELDKLSGRKTRKLGVVNFVFLLSKIELSRII